MRRINLNELRKIFIDFYISKGHLAAKSASLIPKDDKSLLLINSGMAPLKSYFSGKETPPSKRMTNCQKCIRVIDIENVGKTSRHGTFFEMLGSFSFGDYFKRESLAWGWEFLLDVLKMPEDKLWVSVYEEDQEAYDIWVNEIKIDESRIVRLGKEDNFWEIGVGPCGPCSEIYFDRGERYACDNPDCKPGCECDRYVEFWNHVFTQYNRDEKGNYTPLDNPNIDTGMGLERLASILQNTTSIFDVDTIRSILEAVSELANVKYMDGNVAIDVSLRIITDHLRSVVFMISDGVIPSNEGRGYVLRRLIRRAARQGKLLSIDGTFMHKLADKVIEMNIGYYSELDEKADYIKKIIKLEEEKFAQTIDQGQMILNEYIEKDYKSEGAIFSGELAFKLYDTYGFPLELTKEILAEKNIDVDEEEFILRLNKQRETARAAHFKTGEASSNESLEINRDMPTTHFIGYNQYKCKAQVLSVIKNNTNSNKVRIIVDSTPFYAQGGGQSSDLGNIQSEDASFKGRVEGVSNYQGYYLHNIVIDKGEISEGSIVNLEIDIINRHATARNHTATHLLHRALIDNLGNHVLQAGSSVDARQLRFDFNHYEGIDEKTLKDIETDVNREILNFLPVKIETMSIEKAKNSGAIAIFDEKYEDDVRVVSCGTYSKELCGGTHVENTGQIGAFRINSESGIASGTRRIEAVTGTALLNLIDNEKENYKQLEKSLKETQNNLKQIQKAAEKSKMNEMIQSIDGMVASAPEIKGIKFITAKYNDLPVEKLREISDKIRSKNKNSIVVLASILDKKVLFIVAVGDSILDKGYHAGKIIKKVAATAGGGGGGKADMAQAGAKNPDKIEEAFKVAESMI